MRGRTGESGVRGETRPTIRDVWLGNGIVRVLLDTAEVLEAEISAAP